MIESTADYYRLLSDAFGPHVPGTREARKLVYDSVRKALKEQAKIAPHRFDLAAEQRALEKAIVDVEISAKLGEPIPRIKPGTEVKKPEPAPELPPRPAVVQGHAVIQPAQTFRADPFSYRPVQPPAPEPVHQPVANPVAPVEQVPAAGPRIEWTEPPANSAPPPPPPPKPQFVAPPAPPVVPQVYPPFPPELLPQQPKPVMRQAQPKFQPAFLNRDDRVSYARRADPKPQPQQPPPAPLQEQQRPPMPEAARLPSQQQPPKSQQPASKAAEPVQAKPAAAKQESSNGTEAGDMHVLDTPKTQQKAKKQGKVFSPADTSEPEPRRGGALRVVMMVLLAAAIGGAITYFVKPEQLIERLLAEKPASTKSTEAAKPSPTGASISIGEKIEPTAQDLVNLAISQSSQREFLRALASLEQAEKLGARTADFYQARAYAHWGSGDTERAIADYSEALRLDPGNSANFTNRAVAYNARGDYALAIRDLERAIAIDPANPDNWNSRCWSRALAGLVQEAILDCNESLRLRPGDPNTLDSRGFAHLKAGQNSRAIADFEAALKIDSRIVSSIYGRGLARLRTGDRARGNADIAEAKTINPNIEALFAKYGVR